MAASTLEIVFVGLCMFMPPESGEGRTVVLPKIDVPTTVETPRGTTCVEPHRAYIAAPANAGVECPQCVVVNDKLLLFLSGDTVTLREAAAEAKPGGSATWCEDRSFCSEVPKITVACGGFQPRVPASASKVMLDQGTLAGESVHAGEKRARLHLPRNGVVIITATQGPTVRTMSIPTTVGEVTVGNQYVNAAVFGARRDPLADNHWLAFYTMAASPVHCDLPTQQPACETPVCPLASRAPRPRPRDDHHTTIACSVSQYP
jgi:hypothetical protein